MVEAIRASVTSEFGIRPHVHIGPKRTIPTTTSGKVRRQEARRMFLANELPSLPNRSTAMPGVHGMSTAHDLPTTRCAERSSAATTRARCPCLASRVPHRRVTHPGNRRCHRLRDLRRPVGVRRRVVRRHVPDHGAGRGGRPASILHAPLVRGVRTGEGVPRCRRLDGRTGSRGLLGGESSTSPRIRRHRSRSTLAATAGTRYLGPGKGLVARSHWLVVQREEDRLEPTHP